MKIAINISVGTPGAASANPSGHSSDKGNVRCTNHECAECEDCENYMEDLYEGYNHNLRCQQNN